MEFTTLQYGWEDGIATIRLHRPEAMNALNLTMATELRAAVGLVRDSGARVLVLSGTGRAFCAGGDVGAFVAAGDGAHLAVRDLVHQLHGALADLVDLPCPVVAAVNGITAGAGMGVFLAADLAIAAESAVFTMAYTGIAASPDGSSTFFLPRIVGTRRAMELVLTNRRLSAQEALDWGLVNTVVSDHEFADSVSELAGQLRDGPTLAYAASRALLTATPSALAAHLDEEARSIIAMARTGDFKEGITAFAEKRRPDFNGR